MKYDVHIYEVVRVKVPGVEAESQVEAILKARDMYDPHTLFAGAPRYGEVEHTEWAEESAYYLVDEVGDEEYARSKWYPGNIDIKTLEE